MGVRRAARVLGVVAALLALRPGTIRAQCPEEPVLKNYTGGASAVCPCFVPGEEVGAVLTAPAEHYPIQVLRVGVSWGSQTGGAVDSLEGAIHVYAKGLPDPGPRIATLQGPVLSDGAINEFDLEPLAGDIVIDSGPFTVTLEIAVASNPPFGPGVGLDAGCQPGKNVVKADDGRWFDLCGIGASGDWVIHAIYRRVECGQPGEPRFVRGDENGDGIVNIADAIAALSFLFRGASAPPCLDAVDANDDGEADVSDPVTVLLTLFAAGVVIAPPFPACGTDPGPASLGCEGPPEGRR